MATAPVKSQQPLHNFSLSGFLTWGGGSSATSHHHQRHRRPSATSADSSPPTDDSDLESRPQLVGSRSSRSPNHHNALVANEQPPRRSPAPAAERENRIQANGDIAPGRDHADGDNNKVEEADVAARRPWNLRPRKAVVNASLRNGESFSEAAFGAFQLQKESCAQQQPKSVRLRGFAEGGGGGDEKKEKKSKLWISLSKEEIEEDIFVMTGSRPSRRPKKRPRNEQKLIDGVFPGMWLVGITADAYRVADVPVKR